MQYFYNYIKEVFCGMQYVFVFMVRSAILLVMGGGGLSIVMVWSRTSECDLIFFSES